MKKLLDFWGRLSLVPRILLVAVVFWIATRVSAAIDGAPPADSLENAPDGYAQRPAAGPPAANPDIISLAQFGLLQTGITYRQAVVILGKEGAEISSNDIAGTRTVMYQWPAGGMANMNAMFQNDKLISKAQFGLK